MTPRAKTSQVGRCPCAQKRALGPHSSEGPQRGRHIARSWRSSQDIKEKPAVYLQRYRAALFWQLLELCDHRFSAFSLEPAGSLCPPRSPRPIPGPSAHQGHCSPLSPRSGLHPVPRHCCHHRLPCFALPRCSPFHPGVEQTGTPQAHFPGEHAAGTSCNHVKTPHTEHQPCAALALGHRAPPR